MVHFKFRVRAPLVTYWQWVRHRTFHYMSANAQSGRYTPFEEDDFYVPSVWRKQSKSNKQASEGEIEPEISAQLTEKLLKFYEQGYDLYREALDAGVSKEMARLFLPGFSVYYTWVISVDAHNLMNWMRLRMAADAQYEIRVYAEAIYEHFFKPALPWTAEAFETYVLRRGERVTPHAPGKSARHRHRAARLPRHRSDRAGTDRRRMYIGSRWSCRVSKRHLVLDRTGAPGKPPPISTGVQATVGAVPKLNCARLRCGIGAEVGAFRRQRLAQQSKCWSRSASAYK